MIDPISERILKIVALSHEPLETREVQERLNENGNEVSRSKIIYRLSILRGEGKIRGKSVGSGKGNWIWWRSEEL